MNWDFFNDFTHLFSGSSDSKLPLRFVAEPDSTIASKNKEVVINCSASGLSRTTIYWKKDGIRLRNTTARVFLSSGHLVIRRFRSKKESESDEGVYQCFASNNEGTIASRKAKIEIAGELVQSTF